MPISKSDLAQLNKAKAAMKRAEYAPHASRGLRLARKLLKPLVEKNIPEAQYLAASFALADEFESDAAFNKPIVLEYEAVLLDQLEELRLTAIDVGDLLDYLCSVGKQQEVHYLWRPYLKDPKDDLILEAAVAGSCEAIITYNRRDFGGSEKFGVRILTPGEFLRRIGEL